MMVNMTKKLFRIRKKCMLFSKGLSMGKSIKLLDTVIFRRIFRKLSTMFVSNNRLQITTKNYLFHVCMGIYATLE